MEWINEKTETPKTGIDVEVKTEEGKVGVAKYWDLTRRWLTMDKTLGANDVVIEWRYLDKTN